MPIATATATANAAQPDQERPHQWVVRWLGGLFDGHKCVIHIQDSRSQNQLQPSLMNGLNLESGFQELATLWPQSTHTHRWQKPNPGKNFEYPSSENPSNNDKSEPKLRQIPRP